MFDGFSFINTPLSGNTDSRRRRKEVTVAGLVLFSLHNSFL
jgi:hypothetical protein